VAILLVVQIATNLSFEIIALPQLAPALAYLVIILIFRDLYRPIIININKIVLAKTFIAIIFPLAIFTSSYFIGNIKLFIINSFVWLIAAIIITICGRKYYFITAK
jgi:uncharacterized membrane protein